MDNSLNSSGSSKTLKRVDSQPVAPPRSRRTGGWADEAIKSGKRKNSSTNIIEQERFQSPEKLKNDSDDEIPIIPDLDDVQDEELALQIARAPNVAVNRAATYKELDSDLFRHAAFTTIDDVNLQLLTKCLCPENDVREADEVWTWDLLFTDMASELHFMWEQEAATNRPFSE